LTLDKSPQWGFLEIIMVYLGIILSSIVYAMWGDEIGEILISLGIPDNDFTMFISAFLVQFLFTVVLVYFFTVVTNKATFREIGFVVASGEDFLRYGVGGGILLLTIVFIMSIPIGYLNPQLEPQLYEEMLRSLTDDSTLFWLIITGVVLAPLSEEMFYRGMIYPVFRRYLSLPWAMAVSGIIFGLAHFDLWRALPLAVGGMGLCYIYEKTRSILVTAVAHGVWNLIMTLMVIYSINALA
jgi:membrane protease YdiL (CAAX protease family)